MGKITITRNINAPIEKVFQTVAHIENFSRAIPDIVDVEFLSDQKSGKGTRFREKRLMKGREASTELEVKEYEKNRHIRLVADSHGTVWDTLFSVEKSNNNTKLTMTMEARPHSFLAKVMNKLMSSMIRKAIAKDMDAVKVYCES